MFNIDEMLDEVEGTSGQNGMLQPDPAPAAEGSFNIGIRNKTTGSKANMSVLAANQLIQIATGCKNKIGINPNSSNYIFEHERTGKSTSDGTLTVGEFGLKENDVLVINDDGQVAAG